MERPLTAQISPTDIARSRQIDGLRRLVSGRGTFHHYEIDPASSIVEFRVSFFGFWTVVGTFTGLSGKIQYHTSDLRQWSVSAEMPMASLNTGIALRDRHLRSRDYLDVERFPAAIFQSTAAEWQQEGFLVHGMLGIRGVTRAVVIHLEYPDPPAPNATTDQPMDLRGRFSLNRRQFGVLGTGERKRRYDPRDLTIGDMVDIALKIRAIPVP